MGRKRATGPKTTARVLVTGAAGKTGQAVIRALVRRGESVHALVYRPPQAALLERLGAREVFAGDMRDPELLRAAARGVRTIYHIGPNMHPDEVAIGRAVTGAARAAGCERLVYHSVLHPQTEAMPHHWRKLRVEELLFESGLPFTVLQPGAYMQNVLAGWERIARDGVYAVPYAAETRLAMVDLEDVAEAAARVVGETGHDGATYELCGPGYLSQTEVAATLGEVLGHAVTVEAVPLEIWEEGARASGLDEDRLACLAQMFRFYERHGLRGNASVLGWLLGRSATSFLTFVTRMARDLG